jgi:outer membrane receptor protein involved in Fe transport
MKKVGFTLTATVAALTWASAHAQSPRVESELDEVTVTGSRIARKDFVAPTPVTSLSAADLESRGITNINVALRELPSTNSVNPLAGQGASGAGLGGVNLRGLGFNRTLVLVNGRRQVPSTDSGIVDTNTIPSVAISQMELVTGGASAAWGSDAVAGVVNLIYDTKFEGLKMDAQVGASGRGDGREVRVAATSGTTFADDRGHVVAAVEWNKIDDLAIQADRDWGRQNYGIIRNAADTGPADGRPRLLIAPDIRLSGATLGGVITSPGPLANIAFGPGGTLLPFAPGSNTAAPITIGGTNTDSAVYGVLTAPYDRKSLLLSAEYELSESTSIFAEAQYSTTRTTQPLVYNFNFGNLPIANDNAFISPALRARMVAANVTSFNLGRLNSEWGYYTANNRRSVLSAAVGVRGKLGERFNWDAYAQHGEARFDSYQTGNRLLPALNYAVDAVINPVTGQPVCRVTLNLASVPAALQPLARGCVPLNLFGQGSPSPQAVAYVNAESSFDRQQDQDVLAANISGDAFDLWAGPLSVAAGIERRKETVGQQIDAGSVGQLLTFSNGRPANGGFDVTDVYAEVALPLLKELPLARALDLNAAYRHSDYSTVGEVDTWKAGLTWRPFESLLLRASLSSDVRAPNAAEIFSPGIATTFAPQDPCRTASQAANPTIRANCAAQGIPPVFDATLGSITAVQIGNPDVNAEESETRSFGLVFTPGFAPGFEASLDWFQIDLEAAIGVLPGQTLLDSCYLTGSASACGTISRDPVTRAISRVDRKFINIGNVELSGVDFQLGYRTDLPSGWLGGGGLGVRVLGSYLYDRKESVDGFTTFQIAGQVDPTVQALSAGVPKLKLNLSLDYEVGQLGLRPRVRYLGSAKFNNAYGVEDINDNTVESVMYVDLTVDYKFEAGGKSYTGYVGVNNIGDVDPPPAPGGVQFAPVHSNYAVYDIMGRSFFAGVRVKF